MQMDINIITEAFVVVVIGGMGSVLGAFMAALLIGQTHAFGHRRIPIVDAGHDVFAYGCRAGRAAARLLRAQRKGPSRARFRQPEPLRETGDVRLRLVVLLVFAVLAVLPVLVSSYVQIVLAEIFILALFAGSLHLLMSYGGMVSFGHAAYFGVGAYVAAWFASHLGTPMFPALAIGVLGACLVAVAIGWLCTRL